MSLTRKQSLILDFIRDFIEQRGESPTYQEIQLHFGLKSLGSVNDYIKYLKKAGYLKINSNSNSRGFEIIEQPASNLLIPLLGKVAAGSPLEIMEEGSFQDKISVPETLVGTKGRCFALEVQGDSMIDDGIFEGDFVICRKQKTAQNGQTVIAAVDQAATIKRYYNHTNQVELRPSNPNHQPLFVDSESFEIKGLLIALWRQY